MGFLKNMFSGVIKAGALALARHAATLVGTALLTWLLSHHVGSDFAARLVGDVQDIIMTVTGAGLLAAGVGASLKDVGNVGGKMAVATTIAYQQGVAAQTTTDETKVQAVAQAMKAADTATKQDKQSVLAALKAGTF